MIKLILVSVVLLALAFAGIAIKMFFLKDAEFTKSCSSIDPLSGKHLSCNCGGNENVSCENN
jgi:hypothetical protein